MSGAPFDAQLVVTAPAKVNLFFELLARRPDGFHDVETVMTTISLCDTLAFETASNDTIHFQARWAHGLASRERISNYFGDLPQDESNLAVRALNLLRESTGTKMGGRVRLVKRIPSGAGLGGGSSDAAAALIAGNLGWKLGLSKQHLMQLGGELGSDIPFFVSTFGKQKAATLGLCTGRGEKIRTLPNIPATELILVRPPESLGTADVYRQSQVPVEPLRVARDFEQGNIRSACGLRNAVFNRLEQPARELTGWIDRLEFAFSKLPFVVHQMSGSGSTYFGVCKNGTDAQRAQQQLRAANIGHVIRARTGTAMGLYHAKPSTN